MKLEELLQVPKNVPTEDNFFYGNQDFSDNIPSFDSAYSGYNKLMRGWADGTYSGNDLILTIINFIVEKAKEKVLIDSDVQTSLSSQNMLKKWFDYDHQKRHFGVKVFKGTEEIINPDFNDIFKESIKNNYSIVLEDIYGRNDPLYGIGKRIVQEFKWY